MGTDDPDVATVTSKGQITIPSRLREQFGLEQGTKLMIVPTDYGLGGDPRIEDHRIGVYQVYQRYVEGDETPEAIATSYHISVAEVHAALAYAFSNPDEMRDIEARNQALYDETAANRVVPDDQA